LGAFFVGNVSRDKRFGDEIGENAILSCFLATKTIGFPG
jgi:hypothetical protein